MQLWPYNTNSFCYQPFLLCLLCVILSDRRVWQQGSHNSFDSYKPGGTKHRCAKTLPFHYFSITIYIWCEAPIQTVTKIRTSSSSLSLGLPLSARESGEQGGYEEPRPHCITPAHWTLWGSPHHLCVDLGHPPHPWSKTSSVPLSPSYCPHLSSTSWLLHHSRHSLGLGTTTKALFSFQLASVNSYPTQGWGWHNRNDPFFQLCFLKGDLNLELQKVDSFIVTCFTFCPFS